MIEDRDGVIQSEREMVDIERRDNEWRRENVERIQAAVTGLKLLKEASLVS